MAQSTALASLTATYTDSEGEEDDATNTNINDLKIASTPPSTSPNDNKSSTSSRPSSPATVRVTTKVATLVSYHDDTIASDDEGDHDDLMPHHEVIILNDQDAPKTAKENDVIEEKDGTLIPPEPLGHCSVDLQDKIVKLFEKMQHQQLDMNALIQKRKDFRNPSIYEKLIQFCAINELGTNYPPAIYDPVKWDNLSYYEELAKVQKIEMDRREKERKLKVEFVSGTKKLELDESKKRKSKWDQPGGNAVSSQGIKPAGLIQPSLTSSATGTKSTVISAFGSLPKKPRP